MAHFSKCPICGMPLDATGCDSCELTLDEIYSDPEANIRRQVRMGQTEDDLNETQVNALILSFFKDRGWRVPFQGVFTEGFRAGVSSLSGTPGTRSPAGVLGAGLIQQPLGFAYYLSSNTAANGVIIVGEAPLIYPVSGFLAWNVQPFYYAMTLNRSNIANNIAGECFQGIGIGDFGQLTPWATTYASSFKGAVIQHRWNYTLARWEVLAWGGDTGTAPRIEACSTQKPFLVDTTMPEVAIQWTPPVAGVNSRIDFYWDRILVHTILNESQMNNVFISSGDVLANFFITNGSNAAANHAEAGFYTPRIYAPFALSGT